MSDRGRSPEEIEGTISRRQDEFSEDLGELEYRLSRQGVKDRAQEKVSSTAHRVADGATAMKDQAVERARQLGSQTGRQATTLGGQLSRGLERNRSAVSLASGALALAIGIYFGWVHSGAGAGRRGPDQRRYRDRGVGFEPAEGF